MSRGAVPDGGNDDVMTPRSLADAIVRHFYPTGSVMEPCMGDGAFMEAFERLGGLRLAGFDIKYGTDFLALPPPVERWDWIITNPPWSKFLAFLKQSMLFADNIVFLDKLNAWSVCSRLRAMEAAGFEFVEMALVEQPKRPWPQMGLQFAAVHIRRKHRHRRDFGCPRICRLKWMPGKEDGDVR